MKNYLSLFIKGLCMGTVEVIPSISSSTVALLTGIYTDLLQTIHACNRHAWKLLKTGQWKLLWTHLRGDFLLPIFLGIILSLLSTVRLVSYLLLQYPIEIWSFFFGLSIAAVVTVYKTIQKITRLTYLYSIMGLLLSCLIICTDLVIISHAPWVLFFSGLLAMCAMILPGISGSFLLLMLGQYEYLLHAVKNFNWSVLCIFLGGGVLGLFSVSKLVLQLFRNYADTTMAIVGGFMLGSLYQIWPWKNALSAFPKDTVGHFVQAQNILPSQFQLLYQQDPHIAQALLCCVLGSLVVILLTKWGLDKQK